MAKYAQFSLRSLLVLMLAVACYFGGWHSATWKAERDRRDAERQGEREIREAIELATVRARAGALSIQPTVRVITIPPPLGQPIPADPPDWDYLPSPGVPDPLPVEPALTEPRSGKSPEPWS